MSAQGDGYTHPMSRRLQVILSEEEIADYEASARSAGLTLSEWVRRSLRATERQRSHADIDAKITAIRGATQHRFPAPDIDTMIKEIEQGYDDRPVP